MTLGEYLGNSMCDFSDYGYKQHLKSQRELKKAKKAGEDQSLSVRSDTHTGKAYNARHKQIVADRLLNKLTYNRPENVRTSSDYTAYTESLGRLGKILSNPPKDVKEARKLWNNASRHSESMQHSADISYKKHKKNVKNIIDKHQDKSDIWGFDPKESAKKIDWYKYYRPEKYPNISDYVIK